MKDGSGREEEEIQQLATRALELLDQAVGRATRLNVKGRERVREHLLAPRNHLRASLDRMRQQIEVERQAMEAARTRRAG